MWLKKVIHESDIDFHKYRKLAFLFPGQLWLQGIASIYSNKDQILGIDFRGGEESIISFNKMIDPGDLDNTFASTLQKLEKCSMYIALRLVQEMRHQGLCFRLKWVKAEKLSPFSNRSFHQQS